MLKIGALWAGFLLLIVLSTATAVAQEPLALPNRFESTDSSVVIHYPEGWFVNEPLYGGVLFASDLLLLDRDFDDPLAPGQSILFVQIRSAGEHSQSLGIEPEAAPAKYLQAFIKQIGGYTNWQPIERSESDGVMAAGSAYGRAGWRDGKTWFARLNDDRVALLGLTTAPGERMQWEATVLAMAGSVE